MLPGNLTPPAWLSGGGPFPAEEMLAAPNGLIHLPGLAAGKAECVRAPSLDFFGLNVLDYPFRLDAPQPAEWFAFLAKLWPDDKGCVSLLQEWFGYCLLPDTSQQKILMMIGPPRSGKGTVARVLSSLIGKRNVAGPTLSSLGTNFGLWPLLGKTLAVVSDARFAGGKADTAVIVERLLSISGEDDITIDRKNREPVTGKLQTRFVILTNELPRLGDASGALPSRFLLAHAPRSWLGKEDPGLTARLLNELPGILLWAIEGWRRLRAQGHFLQPASGRELLEEMKDLSSPVGAFVAECCAVEPCASVLKKDLYEKFRAWAEAKGQKNIPADSVFARDLIAAAPGVRSARPRAGRDEAHGGHVFQGIRPSFPGL